MGPLALVITVGLISHSTSERCDISKRADVASFDIKLPDTMEVPEKRTTYVCQEHQIPRNLVNKEHYIVGFTPLIDNKDVMHHMILFGCNNGTPSSGPHACGGPESACRSFLTVWSLGFQTDVCLYRNTGISIGEKGFSTLALQIHWNNLEHKANMTDSSGIRIYYTRRRPKYELGNVQIGQDMIVLQPNNSRIQVRGGCSYNCTHNMNEPFYLTRTFIHMHSLGTGGRLDHFRNGTLLQTIAYDQFYSYQKPPVHVHQHAVRIDPGDEVMLTCLYETMERKGNETIYWGEGSDGEMCYAFVSYFPKRPGFDQCIQYDYYDQCYNYNSQSLIMGKCDFRRFLFDVGADIGYIRSQCHEKAIQSCDEKCISALNNIYGHPCTKGSLKVFLQHRVATTVNWKRLERAHTFIRKNCLGHMLF